jgi:SAM-dependent methyltransferase
MATHQAISGTTDDEFLQRMVSSYADRYNEAFWDFFEQTILARLPAHPTIVDLGCGPGLFLSDLRRRIPQATLYGYDVTPAMIEYAKQQHQAAASVTFAIHNVEATALPLPSALVNLICMTAVLHVFDEPLPVLAEIRRLLAPQGIFMLHDWVRTPLQDYLAAREQGTGDELAESRRRGFRLFPAHNKYTADDWCWLLSEAGFTVLADTQLRPRFRLFVTTVTQP